MLIEAIYRGDVSPLEAYREVTDNPNAVLLDVRTEAEWDFVGSPAVKGLKCVSWQVYPQMEQNRDFVAQVAEAGITPDNDIYLICRSGVRSAHAANALTQAGYMNCWNVAGGFEGDRDENDRRGAVNGWKHAGLPWHQG